MGSGADSSQIAYLAFTRAAAKEAILRIVKGEEDISEDAIRVRFPYFRTLHSLAYMGMKGGNRGLKVIQAAHLREFGRQTGYRGRFGMFNWEDLGEAMPKGETAHENVWDRAFTAYNLGRVTAGLPEDFDRARTEIARPARRMGFIEDQVYRTLIRRYEAFKETEGLVDFTDMLEFAAKEMEPLDGVRYVVVDEAQDLAAAHFLILDRLFANAEQVWLIGDDDQCQPAGTRVWLTKDGSSTEDISEVTTSDNVVSYARRGAALVSGKRVLETGCRKYTGPLLSVQAGERATRCTPNHRFIVRWTAEVRRGDACITYLMERDGRWRVGWCQLFNVEGALHFNIRMNVELAHRGWIIRLHRNRTEASVYESILAARYGLPTATFEPVEVATHLTKEAIEAIFDGIGDRTDEARRCLVDHGRQAEYPLIDKQTDPRRHRTTLIETQACNLISDIMALPVVERGGVVWLPLTVSSQAVEETSVYSLKVDTHETYVADGIITHNSIFSFGGASADLFLERYRRASHRIVLRQTHRFGPEIVKYSGRIIHRVRNRVEKDIVGMAGQHGTIIRTGKFTPRKEDALVLHRHVEGCQRIADLHIQAGIPFHNERGRDPLGAAERVKAWMAMNDLAEGRNASTAGTRVLVEDYMPSEHVGPDGARTRLVVHGGKKTVEKLADDHSHINLRELLFASVVTLAGADAITNRHYRMFKHSDDFEYYQRVVANGHQLDEERTPVITTIHGSKGRQAKRVVVFSEMSKRCWGDSDTEHRLAYVAATRTETDLTICTERRVEWARSEYDYPVEAQT
jgi:hypothetical protein